MNEPTMKEIAGWLREAAKDAANSDIGNGETYYLDRAVQVEAMGEKRRCKMDKYEVKRTRCDCHPETCGCDPWTITRNGEFFTRIYQKSAADKIVETLNQGSDFGCVHWKRKEG